jgi:hypothetical protein
MSPSLFLRYYKEYEEALEDYTTEKIAKTQPCYNCEAINWKTLDAYGGYCKECGRGKCHT